jgi:hypothetical protein
MIRIPLFAAAALAALSAAACASQSGDGAAPATATREVTATPMQAAPQTTMPAPAEQGGVYSDDQLRAFITASTEIDPISRTLAGATPEQQAQAATQIREILTRNGLNGETYNAIASQAQADPTFAARINALRVPASPAGTVEPPEPGSPEPTPTNPQ